MKNAITILLLGGLIHFTGSAQQVYETIKISPDLELIKISENAYAHVSYNTLPEYGRIPGNGLIFVHKKRALLFDTPWTDSLTMILVSYLKDHLGLKVTGFIPNHWHEDCMGGLGYLQSLKIKSYANQLTIDIAKTKNIPIPDQGFKDSLTLSLGDKSIYLYYFGAAHSLDNIVIWIPSERILFPGCMCKSLNSENLGNIADGDLKEYPKTIAKVINKFNFAKIVIPGHGQIGGFDLLLHTKELTARTTK
jgi:metallo-beta-lactamase class B